MSILGPSGAYRRQLNIVKKKKRERTYDRVCLCVRTLLHIHSLTREPGAVSVLWTRLYASGWPIVSFPRAHLTGLPSLRRHARRECRYLAITVPRPSPRASNAKRSNAEWGLKNVYRVERAWKIGTDKYEIVATRKEHLAGLARFLNLSK